MGLTLVAVGYGHPDAVLLIEAVQSEYVERYGGRDESPVDPLMFEPPHGTFLVGYADQEPVATGAWRRRTDLEAFGSSAVAEIKRMYVAPAARGAGHARIALYTSSGYTRIPSFGHYRDSPLNRCFGRRLGHT